jgi:SAM-dependent methyltransferase
MNLRESLLLELQIARSPSDPRHIMPPLSERYHDVLDVGCGAGQILLASDLAAGVKAVGIDVELGGLLLGRELTSAVHFACAQGEALPFRDGCFDLIISRVAVPYMHIERALREMHRVLRPEGQLWLVLHSFRMSLRALAAHVASLELKEALHMAFVLVNGTTLHFVGKQFPLPFHRDQYESCQTIRCIMRSLRGAGFDGITVRNERFFVVTAKKL